MVTQNYINDLSYRVVGCAIEVHKHLGPGLLESVYHSCLVEELRSNNVPLQSQVQIPVEYKGKNLGKKLVLDLVINDLIIVELKAVDTMNSLYKAQLLSYLKLANMPKGLLINFHCDNIVNHMVPLVTEEFAKLPKE